jgi:hypothetical protein
MIEVLKISLTTFMIAVLIREEKTPLSWYWKWLNKLPWYIGWPLGGCYRCFVGQICFWYFIFTKSFNLVELGFFISTGIMSSMIYNKLYNWL